jgi:inner membrane protein
VSSIFAHAFAGVSIGIVDRSSQQSRAKLRWLLWLVSVSIAPDLDYAIAVFSPLNHGGLRITHSLLGVMLLPSLTICYCWWRWRKIESARSILLAGVSHLVMDLLVGVTPLPLFWPAWNRTFRLPFGILPSAARLWPLGDLVYRNLTIEIGVLVPFFAGLYLLCQKSWQLHWWTIAILWSCSGTCMYWASTLDRP